MPTPTPSRRTLSALLPILLLTTACATTATRQIELDPAVVEAEEAKQRRLALERQVAYQDRASDLAQRLLTAGAPLCGDDTGPLLGIQFANRHVYQDEWRAAAEAALALSDTVQILTLADGSAAERAGLEPGDLLLEVEGEAVPMGEDGVEFLAQRFEELLPGDGSAGERLELTVRRGRLLRTVTVTPDRACDYSVQVVRASALNAFADGERIYLTTTMMRFADDHELSVVLAHEIAHNAMDHIEKQQQNAILGGLLGAAFDVLAASQGVNTGGSFTSAGIESGAISHSQDFEREADYVGLYLMARAGLPLEDAPRFWRHMAQENPESIDFAHTHPTSAERFVRMERAVEEIREKEANELPLRPEMKAGEEEDQEGG